MTGGGSLAVLVDGVALPEDQARALWERFSAWMEEHRGDLAGFAAAEGFTSVHPGIASGRPVLHASRSAPQRPYGAVAQSGPGGGGPSGGSGARHKGSRRDRAGSRNPRK